MTPFLLTVLFALLFFCILIILHVVKPELDPSWRMISEYELGRFGWLMRVAFLCWGAAVFFLTLALWPSLQSAGGLVARIWFLLIVLALIGASIFTTDPITDQTGSLTNKLHQLCGSIVILTFPIAATIASFSLAHNPLWAELRVALLAFTLLTWLGMIAFFVTITVARKRNPQAGQDGTHIPMGWPNRILVITYLVWLIALASFSAKL